MATVDPEYGPDLMESITKAIRECDGRSLIVFRGAFTRGAHVSTHTRSDRAN